MKTITIFNSKNETGIHYTINHSGKMAGMYSLSTSCVTNNECRKRYESNLDDCVCTHCYSNQQLKFRSNMNPCLEQNTRILTESILPKNTIPAINALYFRFESFGDLNNWIQVVNYFNICKANKKVKFALWTKNPWYIEEAISKGYAKPKNLQIVLSSVMIDKCAEIKYSFVDKVFTVYRKKTIKEQNININCGAKNCLTCHKCYDKGNEIYINEKLK